MKTNFHKNQFRSDFTYADAVRYIDERTVRSENLVTPRDRAEQNYRHLKYQDALRRQEEMERHNRSLSQQDAAAITIAVLIIAFITLISQ